MRPEDLAALAMMSALLSVAALVGPAARFIAWRRARPQQPPLRSQLLLALGQLAVGFAEWAYDAAERIRKAREPGRVELSSAPPAAAAPLVPDVHFFELGLPVEQLRAINMQLKWRMASTEGRARS